MVAICYLIYWPALRGEFLWDDPAHITRPELRSSHGLYRIWFELGATQEYYPVLHSAFWLEHRWWQDSPWPYHAWNVLLHAINACLVMLVVRRLGGASEPAEFEQHPSLRGGFAYHRPTRVGGLTAAPITAWLAALLFAVHPVAVESVAWITEQKNTLSTAFYLVSVLCYLAYDDAVAAPGENRRRDTVARRALYVLAFTLYVLALGAKTMTVTLPAALLVLRWWRRGRLRWGDIVPLVPWFVVAIVAGLLTRHVETTWVGAQGDDYALTWPQRSLLATRVIWFSLGQLVWPCDLTFFYPRWEFGTEALRWTAGVVATLGTSVVLWRLRHRSRAALALWLLYVGTLFPVLGFMNVFSFSFSYVADHYQYLAIPVVAVAMARTFVVAAFGTMPRRPGVSVAVIALVLFALGGEAHRLSARYKDDETLFRSNIAVNPGSWMGHHILAHALAKKSPRNFDTAVSLYEHALQLKPRNPDSHFQLGRLLAERPGQRAAAIVHYLEALRLRPIFPEALNALGVELAATSETLPDAVMAYQRAIAARPDFVVAHANLGDALAHLPGRERDAEAEFKSALQLAPAYAMAHSGLADLYAREPGRQREAVEHYETALRLDPTLTRIHYQVAVVLAQLPGGAPEARAHGEAAARLFPLDPRVHNLLGILHAEAGERDAARAEWNEALRLDPALAAARRNLQSLEQ